MINFTKRYVNTTSFIISIIIFCFLNHFILSIKKIDFENNFLSNKFQSQIQDIKNYSNEKELNENLGELDQKIENTQEKVENCWQIEIPKINLKASIAEGTTKEIMDYYVGHFEETSKDNGNVGLAAHNRGYRVNYFENLKNLKEGDEIIYTCNGKQRKYIVKILKIIKDTDWSLLENTEDNRVTLVTCVENEPEYRRCIQAIEI